MNSHSLGLQYLQYAGNFIFKIVQEKYEVKRWEGAERDDGGVMNVVLDAATLYGSGLRSHLFPSNMDWDSVCQIWELQVSSEHPSCSLPSSPL